MLQHQGIGDLRQFQPIGGLKFAGIGGAIEFQVNLARQAPIGVVDDQAIGNFPRARHLIGGQQFLGQGLAQEIHFHKGRRIDPQLGAPSKHEIDHLLPRQLAHQLQLGLNRNARLNAHLHLTGLRDHRPVPGFLGLLGVLGDFGRCARVLLGVFGRARCGLSLLGGLHRLGGLWLFRF